MINSCFVIVIIKHMNAFTRFMREDFPEDSGRSGITWDNSAQIPILQRDYITDLLCIYQNLTFNTQEALIQCISV